MITDTMAEEAVGEIAAKPEEDVEEGEEGERPTTASKVRLFFLEDTTVHFERTTSPTGGGSVRACQAMNSVWIHCPAVASSVSFIC